MAMKKALSLLVLIIPLFCCTKVSRVDVAEFDVQLDYDIVTNGNGISVVKSITRQQVTSKLDLPADPNILSVNIEYIEGIVIALGTGTATKAATVAANIKVGSMEKPLVKETKIAVKQAGSQSSANLTSLAVEGINLLKSQLIDWFNNYSSINSIAITAFAAPDPVGTEKFEVLFRLRIIGKVSYQHCIDIPKVIRGNSEECAKALLN
jgi:hypothetical protein